MCLGNQPLVALPVTTPERAQLCVCACCFARTHSGASWLVLDLHWQNKQLVRYKQQQQHHWRIWDKLAKALVRFSCLILLFRSSLLAACYFFYVWQQKLALFGIGKKFFVVLIHYACCWLALKVVKYSAASFGQASESTEFKVSEHKRKCILCYTFTQSWSLKSRQSLLLNWMKVDGKKRKFGQHTHTNT